MTSGKRLSKSYYLSDNVVGLARDLLGKFIVTNIEGITCGGMIVEAEAYRGPDDKACHT